MSRTIDLSNGVEGLDEDELLYLAQRDNQEALAELQRREISTDQSGGRPLEEVANTGDANTRGESIEELEARLARMKAEQAADEDESDEEDDEEMDYESMSNDDLRAELARRDLSVSGKKEDLIARLEADDASEEDDEDEEG